MPNEGSDSSMDDKDRVVLQRRVRPVHIVQIPLWTIRTQQALRLLLGSPGSDSSMDDKDA